MNAKFGPVKEVKNYLPWYAVNDLAIDLNPKEPATFVIGRLIDEWVFAEDFKPYFRIEYFQENVLGELKHKFKEKDLVFRVVVYSENADSYRVNISIKWPKDPKNLIDLADHLDPKLETTIQHFTS